MQNHKSRTMTKFIVTAIMAIMLLFGFALPSSIVLANIQRYESINVQAATNEITVSGIKKSYNLGDTMQIPTGNGAEVIVKDPRGADVELGDPDGDHYNIVANYAGDYSVEYRQGNSTTGEIYITVSSSTPSFNFNTTNKKLIPSEIATNTNVVFPNPEVLDEDGEVIDGATATLTIRKAGSSTPLTTTRVEEEGQSFESYNFTEEGVYSVVYSYRGTGYNYIDQKYTIEVEEGYQDDVDLTFTLDSSLPTSLIQGVETELPTVTGHDRNNNNATVDVIATVNVEYLNSDGTYTAVEVNDYKFTPPYAGTYRIRYMVTDFYGNTYERVYDPINDVRDSRAPTIQIVNDYELEEDGSVSQDTIDAFQDLSSQIPSIVATGTTVTLPAIYASDNVANFADLSLRRLIKDGTDQIANLDDTSNDAYAENVINHSVQYTFENEGTYTIVYKASDATNTTVDSLYSFTIVVRDGFNDTVAPTITVREFATNESGASIDTAEPGQTIRIVKPTVVDYEDPADASNRATNDTRPTLKVYAQIGSLGERTELTLSEDETYYEYTIPKDASEDLIITYMAKDCSNNEGNGTNPDGLVRTLDIINTNENTLPEITGVSTLPEINQYDTISLNGNTQSVGEGSATPIVITDDVDTNVQFKIIVALLDGDSNISEIVDDGLSYTSTLTKAPEGGSTRTITSANFVANRAGNYVVNYIAYDHAGNYTVQTATFSVVSKATPVLVVNDYTTEMELGQAFIPQARLYIDGQIDEGATIETTVEGDINQIGTVKVTYSGTGSNQVAAEEVTISITIKDSVDPTIIIDGEVPAYADLVRDAEDNTLYQEIQLPGFSATDSGSRVDRSTYKITVKNSNDVEVASTTSASGLAFRPTGDGKYTVEYSVSDYAGNAVTQTYTISVGDVDRPTLTINTNIATDAKLSNGSYSLNIDTSKITITDTVNGEETTLDNDDYLSVTVTNSSGSTIEADEDTNYVFTLTEAGEYTITITAEDRAGNTRTETYTLDLAADDNNASTTTEVLGTILLVIAILVLIGVVWYFVKPAPKSKKDKNKKKASAIDVTDNKDKK